MKRRNTAILIFDDVEVLDFAGPFEVFSVTDELSDYQRLNVYTVAREDQPITTRNGLSVNPKYTIKNAPKPDILIIPGGEGTREVIEQGDVITWIFQNAVSAEKVFSVCSGALLLAKAGLLKGLKATTHYQVFDVLESIAPDTRIIKGQRFVDNGKIATSAGISAGIDLSLYVIEQMFGAEIADSTADYMEYRRL
ncbi:DJ-1/PfpI family protein [bacterium]|nr:DJ-1/PfpI family protein [bacterium]